MSRPYRLPAGPRRTLAALAETVSPSLPEVSPDDGPDAEYLTGFVEGFVARMPPHMKALAPWGLRLFEWGALLLGGGLRPFSRLGDRRRRAYLDLWRESRWAMVRNLVDGFVGLCLFGFWDHPAARAHIGYGPAEHAREAARRRQERYGADIARKEAAKP